MKPLIWKELRENMRWALLLMLGMSVALTFILWDTRPWYENRRAVTITSEEFQAVTVFGCGIAALLLGFLQIIPELRRDRWSFLLHRPASRNALFWGKVISGAILYSVAVLIPLVAATLWTALPGHVIAPFYARMILPSLTGFLMGFCYYFAAMLTALRQARIFGTRGIPLVATLLASVGGFAAHEFHQAVYVMILSWSVLGIAAHGAFVGGGAYKPLSRPARFSTGLLLACGLFLVAAFGAALTASAIQNMNPRRYTSSNYCVSTDGRILVVRNNGSTTTITNQQGQLVQFPEPERYYHHMADFRAVVSEWNYDPGFCDQSRSYQLLFNNADEVWYYRYDLKLFQSFDGRTRLTSGWMGRNGFHRDRANAEPFSQLADKDRSLSYGTMNPMLRETRAVYQLDLGKRSIRKIYEAPEGERIRGALTLPTKETIDDSSNALRDAIVIATSSEVVVLDREAHLLFKTPSRSRSIQAGIVEGNRLMLWYNPGWSYKRQDPDEGWVKTADGSKRYSSMEMLSIKGEKLDSHELPPLESPWHETETHEAVLMGGVPVGGYISALLVGLVCAPPATEKLTWSEMWHEFWQQLTWYARHNHTPFIITMSVLLTFIVVSWLLCEMIGRRYAYSVREKWAWRILSFLLGFFTVPTMLSLREWPARVSCPACTKRRRADRDVCEHCGAPFPPAELRPGDIYDADCPQGSNEPARRATPLTA